MKVKFPLFLMLALIMVPVCADPAMATNGAWPIGFSERSKGRGGTNIAVADDAGAIIDNPAGMAFSRGYRGYPNRFDFAAGLFLPVLEFKNDFGTEDSDKKVQFASAFGLIIDPAASWDPKPAGL